jgi:tetratricopeptide (TPR) repeat protein
LREALQHREQKLGIDHPDTLASKNNLALLYQDQRKFDRAESLLLECLHQREKKLGADHRDTLASKNNLAGLYRDQAKYDKAEPLYQQALAGASEKLGFPHPNTQAFLRNLADLYGRWGKPEKAEPLLQKRLDFVRQKAGADSPDTAEALAELSVHLLRQKKYAQAEKSLRECLRIREKVQPDLWTTFHTRSLLGDARLGQNKFQEAEPLLVQGYEGLEQRAALIPQEFRQVRLVQALERLVRLCEATGQKARAARWRDKLDETKTSAPKQPLKK